MTRPVDGITPAGAATVRPPSDLLLGPLRPAHRERVGAIVREARVFRAGEVDVALEVFDAAFRPGQTDYHLAGAFDRDGALLGWACFGPTAGAVDTWDLYWIAVHPDAQGMGVGRALWDEVERNLRARAARLCVIETSARSDYDPTRRFYTALGLQAAARVPDYYDDGDDLVIYTKRLRSPASSAEGRRV